MGRGPVRICIPFRGSSTTLHILHSTPSKLGYQCEHSYKIIAYGHWSCPSEHGYKLFLERLLEHHSYKLPLFGHGPGHVLVCIAAGLFAARALVSVQLLGTTRESGGLQFGLDCLRHRPRKLLLTSSTVVSVNIMTPTDIFNRRHAQSQPISCISIVLVFDYLLYPADKNRNISACWWFM